MTHQFPVDEFPCVALVNGASRGIGLALVELLIAKNQFPRVIATCRNPESASDLKRLVSIHPNRARVLQLDVTDSISIANAAGDIANKEGTIHCVINSAGILHGPDGPFPEKRLQDVSAAHLEHYFRVNAIGPLLLAKHLVPLMPKRGRAVIASISARVGSIGDNRLGGWYGYRASKSAQNMFTKTLSIELARINPDFICVGLHPGTVATRLSAPFSSRVDPERLFSPEEAAKKLLQLIEGLGPKDTGKLFAHDGSVIPW